MLQTTLGNTHGLKKAGMLAIKNNVVAARVFMPEALKNTKVFFVCSDLFGLNK